MTYQMFGAHKGSRTPKTEFLRLVRIPIPSHEHKTLIKFLFILFGWTGEEYTATWIYSYCNFFTTTITSSRAITIRVLNFLMNRVALNFPCHLVRSERLELSRLTALASKTSVSAIPPRSRVWYISSY